MLLSKEFHLSCFGFVCLKRCSLDSPFVSAQCVLVIFCLLGVCHVIVFSRCTETRNHSFRGLYYSWSPLGAFALSRVVCSVTDCDDLSPPVEAGDFRPAPHQSDVRAVTVQNLDSCVLICDHYVSPGAEICQ